MQATLFNAALKPVPREQAAAAVLALLLHLSVWLAVPATFNILKTQTVPETEVELLKELDLPEELLPEDWRKKFVPANPDAPAFLPPEETMRTSAADQRAAQENPDINSRSRRPALDGESEESEAVNNRVSPQKQMFEAETVPAAFGRVREKFAGTPAAASEKDLPSADETLAAEAVKARIDDDGGVPVGEVSGRVAGIIEGVPEPREAPRTVSASSGINTLLMKSNSAANEIGSVSVDAKFSEYGEYMQRFLETVQASWYKICEHRAVGGHGRVVVEFTMNSRGEIVRSKIIEATTGQIEAYACRDAVESPAPYEPWTEEMTKILGGEDTGTIAFHYR